MRNKRNEIGQCTLLLLMSCLVSSAIILLFSCADYDNIVDEQKALHV